MYSISFEDQKFSKSMKERDVTIGLRTAEKVGRLVVSCVHGAFGV